MNHTFRVYTRTRCTFRFSRFSRCTSECVCNVKCTASLALSNSTGWEPAGDTGTGNSEPVRPTRHKTCVRRIEPFADASELSGAVWSGPVQSGLARGHRDAPSLSILSRAHSHAPISLFVFRYRFFLCGACLFRLLTSCSQAQLTGYSTAQHSTAQHSTAVERRA